MKKINKIFFNDKWNIAKSLSFFNTKSHNNKKNFYPNCSSADLKNTIISAKNGFEKSSKYNANLRSKILKKISKIIKLKKNHLAKLEALETGKPFDQALKEVNYCLKLWFVPVLEIRDLLFLLFLNIQVDNYYR